jgi:hypothetical protein
VIPTKPTHRHLFNPALSCPRRGGTGRRRLAGSLPCRLPAAAGLLLLFAAAGCGGDPERTETGLGAGVGEVDTSLPPAQQARQEVIRRILITLQEGTVKIEALSGALHDVRFDEPADSFYEGAIGLARWNFAGPPRGDNVQVVLMLREPSSAGGGLRRVERVYTVSGSEGRWSVGRKR